MSRQAQVPFSGIDLSETGTRQSQVPFSGVDVSETVSAAPTFLAAWAVNANTVIQPGARTA